MYCSKFSDAIRDLKELVRAAALYARQLEKDGKPNDIQTSFIQIAMMSAYAIEYGERFFVPDGRDILEQKPITPEIKEYLNLPYDCIVVLSTDCVYGEGNERTKIISIAFTPKYFVGTPSSNYMSLFAEDDILILSVVYDKHSNKWSPSMGAVMNFQPINTTGFTLKRINAPYFDMFRDKLKSIGRHYSDEIMQDVHSIQNLCLMLGLKNVSTATINPDAKLVKKREKTNKTPLFSYKVIKVDNVLWDKTERNTSGGSFGCRSHMRRGHIRQLANGNRVWVRATMVKGSIPGFVDKEYHCA